MKLLPAEQLLLAWLALTSLWTFALFGWDKWQAGRSGRRVAEFWLLAWCALGGWPGGLSGLLMFHHKSAKRSFQLKFAAAFLVWAGVVAAVLRLTGRL